MQISDLDQEQQDDVSSGSTGGGVSILDRLVAFVTGGGDPSRERKKLLKQIGKILKKHKQKFYRPKGEQAQPPLARFFFELYKVLGPAQVLIEHADSSGLLRTIVIESHLPKQLGELRDHFTEDYIRERLKEVDTKQLSSEIKDEMITFFSAFDAKKVKEIDAAYQQLSIFLDFVHYDFYFFLKKFDSSLQERNFTATPKFEAINGEYVSDDLKDFLEVSLPLTAELDWDRILDMLKEYRGMEVVARPAWKKMLGQLRDVLKSGVLELVIRHIDEDPYFKASAKVSRDRIVEPYLNKLKAQTEITIQKILQEKRNARIDHLLKLIFGTSAISRMKNYTEKANTAYAKRLMGGFTHVAPMNFLKAFLLDYFKKDIREIVDLLLIRGQWSTNLMSQQLSECFHELMQISDQVIQFDDALADDGELGMKLKKLSGRPERDQGGQKLLQQMMKEINGRAQRMINDTAQNLISIGKNVKLVIEDYRLAPHHEVIINWKEIEIAAGFPITERMTELYKQIYYFVQLMQMYARSSG